MHTFCGSRSVIIERVDCGMTGKSRQIEKYAPTNYHDVANLLVLWPKIMAPLAHTVRLQQK